MAQEFYISDQIKSSASKCCKSHSCLCDDTEDMCKVVFAVNCKILGVHCSEENFCTYKHTMEDRTCCTCPVRIELYHKYNR